MCKIYYRDADIVVCQKPAGLLSEGEGEGTMPAVLSKILGEDRAKIYPVHRLDRETEGIMVYALSARTAASLSAQFAEHKTRKEYVATVHGVPKPSEGRMRDLLFFDRARGRSYPVSRMRKGVKEAELSYRLLDTENGISRVRVRLHTGRTHQIRVQFASRKMPLVGDRRYGALAGDPPFSLRACLLSFSHPTTGETMTFED